ncbi:hypothetical protein ACN6RC_16850, partial [Acinetobacter baumannii]|uniref:hypothetical protein n=1 Tax=Acinetobacter baumannii TaxID=470 RepID=UPI003AFAAC4F
MKFSIFKSPNTVFDLTAKTCKSNDSYSKRNLLNNMKPVSYTHLRAHETDNTISGGGLWVL